MKLSEYVSQVVNDPKYGHDIEWVRGNLHRAHIESIEAAHDAEVRASGVDEAWLERVNAALWKYDQGSLDVRGVAATLAAQDTEEPEWEWSGESIAFPGTSLMQAYAVRANAEHDMQPGYRLVRRRKAGPWEPAQQEGETDEH